MFIESNNEIRACRTQKEEAERHQQLQEEKADLVIRLLLWRLYHTEKDTERLRTAVQNLDKDITDREKKLVSSPSPLLVGAQSSNGN